VSVAIETLDVGMYMDMEAIGLIMETRGSPIAVLVIGHTPRLPRCVAHSLSSFCAESGTAGKRRSTCAKPDCHVQLTIHH
jgi:hypothetical protein